METPRPGLNVGKKSNVKYWKRDKLEESGAVRLWWWGTGIEEGGIISLVQTDNPDLMEIRASPWNEEPFRSPFSASLFQTRTPTEILTGAVRLINRRRGFW
jgi:hypothetical protein